MSPSCCTGIYLLCLAFFRVLSCDCGRPDKQGAEDDGDDDTEEVVGSDADDGELLQDVSRFLRLEIGVVVAGARKAWAALSQLSKSFFVVVAFVKVTKLRWKSHASSAAQAFLYLECNSRCNPRYSPSVVAPLYFSYRSRDADSIFFGFWDRNARGSVSGRTSINFLRIPILFREDASVLVLLAII